MCGERVRGESDILCMLSVGNWRLGQRIGMVGMQLGGGGGGIVHTAALFSREKTGAFQS